MQLEDNVAKSLWRALTRDTDLRRRFAITVGLLAMYWAAAYVPVDGLTPEAYSMMLRAGGFERFSVVALGVGPLVTALSAAVLCNLVARVTGSPRVLAPYDGGGHLRPWVLVLGLLLGTISALQYGLGLELSLNAVREPGLMFKLGCAIEMLAGFLLCVSIADAITRHGIGSGLWVLFSAPYVASIYGVLAHNQLYFETGAFGGYDMAALAVYSVAPIALIVVLSRARPTSVDLQSFIWPPLLAAFVIETLVTVPLARLSAWGYFAGTLFFGPSDPLWIWANIVLILAVAVLQMFASAQLRGRFARTKAILFSALPGVVVALAHDLMRRRGLSPPVEARMLIVIIVTALATVPLFFRLSLQPRWPTR